MLLLFEEFCRFIAAFSRAASTRDALLIEWGGLGLLGLRANPTARAHGIVSCASTELREPKDGHDACGHRRRPPTTCPGCSGMLLVRIRVSTLHVQACLAQSRNSVDQGEAV